ncbi:hypothetical protein F5Y10DRAFT_237021 [Nemania abortiva]|nr:hypothetical protein F5Y10DRAFT_237021 [Nemania abortiva]
MTLRCRDFKCGHEHIASCQVNQISMESEQCCECGGPMYKSQVHTPASSYSAGSGMCSLGPAGSAVFMNDFDRQLKEKLEALDDDPVAYNSKLAAGLAAQKVAIWKQGIDDLLNDGKGEGMVDPHTTADNGDRNQRDEDNGRIGGAQEKDNLDLSKRDNSNLLGQINNNGTHPQAKAKKRWGFTFSLFSSINKA